MLEIVTCGNAHKFCESGHSKLLLDNSERGFCFQQTSIYPLLLYFTGNLKKVNDSNLGFHNQLL